ncbi:MAG: gamma carbonic anhydrase family protein [Planctomycetales bacterium 12-60-4]|nr:MAG: gamma carbonic anhydrase family protein [Planctomycetales bacterium 12-60-4]
MDSPPDPFRRPQPEWPPLPCLPAPEVPFADDRHWDWNALRTTPLIDSTAWVAPGAVVYGRVRVQARSSIWFGCVLRGDHEWIDVGEETNIQDGSILHVDAGYPCLLGNRVTLGHRAIVHASVVEDEALIAIGATVLSRCIIGRGALIAAGAVVLEGTQVPPGTLWAGCPAKQIKTLTPEQQTRIALTYRHYVNNAAGHRTLNRSPEEFCPGTGDPLGMPF